MDCWVIGRCAAELIGGRELSDGLQLTSDLHDVNSANKSSRSQTKRQTNSLCDPAYEVGVQSL